MRQFSIRLLYRFDLFLSEWQSSARRIRFLELGTAGVMFRETELVRQSTGTRMKYTIRHSDSTCLQAGTERQVVPYVSVGLPKSDLALPLSKYRKFFHHVDSFRINDSLVFRALDSSRILRLF